MSWLTSSFTCQLISIIISTLIIHHSFTPGSKPTFSTNPSHLRLLLPTGLPSWQRDWTEPIMLIVLFLVSHFNFFICSVWWTKLATRQLLYIFYCTLHTHYRIVSYRMGNADICLVAEILWKTASPRKLSLKFGNRLQSYGQKAMLTVAAVRHLELWQELSYRKQIARQLRTQYVEGICRSNYPWPEI